LPVLLAGDLNAMSPQMVERCLVLIVRNREA
jgi:hypothetical protein